MAPGQAAPSPTAPAPADPGAAPSQDTPTVGNTGADAGIEPCSRSPADIMTVVGRHSMAINKCLVIGQRKKRLTKGTRTVDVEFLVLPSGKIENVRVNEEDTRDKSLQICISKIFNTVTFPPVKGGACPVDVPLNVAKGHAKHRSRSH